MTVTETIKKGIRKDWNKWYGKSYENRCSDIGQIIAAGILIGVVFYAIGPMDYLNWLSNSLDYFQVSDVKFAESLTDEEKNMWLIIILGYMGGVTLLPLLLLNYGSGWIGYGVMYVVWRLTR